MKPKQHGKKNANKNTFEGENDTKINPYEKETDEYVNQSDSEDLKPDESESDDSSEDQSEDDSEVVKEIDEYKNQSNSEDSESEESESDDSSGNENEDFDHKWQELRDEAPDTDEITRRIAVCNMDWDRIRAIDLFVCFDSFKPADGRINSVKIYPSEFGLQRMEEEKLKGPPELTEETLPEDKEELDDKKKSKYHREKLRQYQINRLKYYYAVVDCDSPETANTLYEQLNGMEYESSAVRFDLRFIPDDMTFDHEPTSVVDKTPDLTEYKPRLFVTTALQQVKVDLTWDETDPKRKEFFQKVFTDPDSVENEIQDYLASASSESEEEETETDDKEVCRKRNTQERIAKYRELLLSIEEKEKQKEEEKWDIEVTWEPGLKEKTKEKVKEKMKKDSLNPFEELLLKKKEDKKLKKKEQKLLQKQAENSDENEEEIPGNMVDTKSGKNKKLAELALITDSKEESFEENTKKKKKAKSQELEGFVGDLNDPRFSAMYTSSLFNMTSSDHQPKSENNFGFKKPKNKKFKSKYNEHKNAKKARYH